MASDNGPLVFLVVGQECSGKTSALRRWTANEFDKNEFPSTGLEVFLHKVDNVQVIAQEIAAYDPWFRSGWCVTRKELHGLVIMYNMCDKETDFDFIKYCYDLVQDRTKQDKPSVRQPVPCVVIANHLDEKDRRVTTARKGSEYAGRLGALYFEISALTGEGVREALDSTVRYFDMLRSAPII